MSKLFSSFKEHQAAEPLWWLSTEVPSSSRKGDRSDECGAPRSEIGLGVFVRLDDCREQRVASTQSSARCVPSIEAVITRIRVAVKGYLKPGLAQSGMDSFMNNESERLSLHITDSKDETFKQGREGPQGRKARKVPSMSTEVPVIRKREPVAFILVRKRYINTIGSLLRIENMKDLLEKRGDDKAFHKTADEVVQERQRYRWRYDFAWITALTALESTVGFRAAGHPTTGHVWERRILVGMFPVHVPGACRLCRTF
ncbi:MAG: hypothetical protein J3Q66DRAFT_368609 [Benniella sp.]|nr:MAG: hypothetical protein J3Q66DRAFT_368609 [Benniella sp.]